MEFENEYLNGKLWNVKEYDKDGKIIFEFKDGKGFCKEYNELNILAFEGEYLNGERNGKGKEYNFDEKLEFEGEYLNGKRNGKGIEFNIKGDIIFKGKYLNGLRILND